MIQGLKCLADICSSELLTARGCTVDLEELLSGRRAYISQHNSSELSGSTKNIDKKFILFLDINL